MSGDIYYQQSYKSSKRPTSQARRSDQKRTSELVTFPELWGTFVSEADEREMDQWRQETEEMLAGTPSYTRGQSVRDDSQATCSSRKRSRDDDHCRSAQPAKRQRRSVSRDRAVSRVRVSRERGYDANRSRATASQGRQYHANSVYSGYYNRLPARMHVNRNHYRFSHLYYYQQSYKSSKRPTSHARRSDQKRTSELVTFPELWGTFVSEADERQMDQWRRETEEMLAGTPSYTRGQSVRGDSQATSSGRKRSREDDHCRSTQSVKRQRRSVSRDRAVSRDRVSRERSYEASRSRATASQGRQYHANSVYSGYYNRIPSRMHVNRNHYRFSHLYY